MVIVKIAGGIGNQMFMLAYAKMLQLRKYKVCLDTKTFFEYDQIQMLKSRKIRLSKNELVYFNIDIPNVSLNNIPYKYLIGEEKSDALLNFCTKTGVYHFYDWANIQYCDKYLKEMVRVKDHSYIFGYFQNEKFFKRYEKEIRNVLTPKKIPQFSKEFNRKRNRELPLVSMHFRRTDYRSEKNFDIADIAYYRKAVLEMKKKIGKFDICIFSDECEWVKKNLKLEGINVLFPTDYLQYEDYEELLLMSQCNHNIIANSTFSWWGAWLNPNQDKIVIAPKKWLNYRKTSIVPKDWIQL